MAGLTMTAPGIKKGRVFVMVILTRFTSSVKSIDIYKEALSARGLKLHEKGTIGTAVRFKKTIENWEGSSDKTAIVIEVFECRNQKDVLEFFKGVELEDLNVETFIERTGKITLSVYDFEAVHYAFGSHDNLGKELIDLRGIRYNIVNQRLDIIGLFAQVMSAKQIIEEMLEKRKIPSAEVNRLMFKYLEEFHQDKLNMCGELDVQDSPQDAGRCLIKSKAKKHEEWEKNMARFRELYCEKTRALLLWNLKVPFDLDRKDKDELCKRLSQFCSLEDRSSQMANIKVVCETSKMTTAKEIAQELFGRKMSMQLPKPTGATALEREDKDHGRIETNNSQSDMLEFGVTLNNSLTVKVINGDITRIRCDAIVNAANSRLSHGAGVAGAILAASDLSFQEQCYAEIARRGCNLEDGEVFTLRSTGSLQKYGIKFVINAVGPSYSNCIDDAKCERLLKKAVFASLKEAEREQCLSIAIPAISSGIYGVPMSICTEAYWKAVIKFLSKKSKSLKGIHFVSTDGKTATEIAKAFEENLRKNSPVIHSAKIFAFVIQPDGKFCDETDKERHSQTNDPVKESRSTVSAGADIDPNQAGAKPKRTQSKGYSPEDAPIESGIEAKKTKKSNTKSESTSARGTSYASAVKAGQDFNREQNADTVETGHHSNRAENRREVDLREECGICFEEKHPGQFTKLPCEHRMCTQCFTQVESITKSNLCPICKRPFKAASGPQPKGGQMTMSKSPTRLPGFENFTAIIIEYYIPSGTQSEEHPNPGHYFHGASRRAYLPDNEHGNRVCRMLRKAFDAGLIFTVGTSLSSGMSNTVVWNDIHHKTSLSGEHGYPDPNYLPSVEADLRARGITDG